MNIRSMLTFGVLFIGAVALRSEPPDSAKQAELMQKAVELAMPGPEHKILADWAGTWDMEIKMNMEPGQPPMTVRASAECEMMLGGRFLQMRSAWDMMGMPSETFTIMGFDRRKGEFTWISFDSHGTYYVTAAGKYDDATKTITMSGTDDDPVFGHKQVYDVVMTIVDNDTHVAKIIFKNPEITQGKGDFTMVEVTSTRRK